MNTINFLHNLYKKNGTFSYSPRNTVSNLFSTIFGVLALKLFNKIDTIDRRKTCNFIKNMQSKSSGLFYDKSLAINKASLHNKYYINLQLTDFSILAIKALGGKPSYPLLFLHKYKNERFLSNWINKLDWSKPWLISNLIMFILNLLIFEQESEDKNNQVYINLIMEWLSEHQDSQTGFWNLGYKTTIHEQMAAAYHFLIFYTYLNLKPQYINQIIDSTLLIQDFDGLFNYAGGGGSCDDLDAIDILCRTTIYTDYRKENIRSALKKSHKNLLKNQNADGGFCWAKRNKISLKKNLHLINVKLLKTSPLDFKANSNQRFTRKRKLYSHLSN